MKLKLKDLLTCIDSFQYIQIISGNTGKYLTGVDYLEDSRFYEGIESYLNCEVLGITPYKCDDCDLFILISVNTNTRFDWNGAKYKY